MTNPPETLTISSSPVISKTEVMPGVYLIWLEAPRIAAAALPGQFLMVRCGEETVLRRPLSIHQTDGNRLALLFAVVGRGTEWLSRCQSGDSIDLFGPLGNGFHIHPGARSLLLVAGGIGIAPLRFLADEAVKQGERVTLLYGTPDKHRYPPNLLPPGIELVAATEDGSTGRKGRVTDLLPEFTSRADRIFACGPAPMYHTMAAQPSLKAKSVQVSLEMRMGCGVGVCYGCTVKTKSGLKQVCQDGPVFELSDLDNINWDELIL